ncbi:hypothetical protein ESCO_006540 [Escovopsis weberi]|uniref:Transcription factor domain-containing protein n=1 Tax=Escovopsis weberi TaxID=150374 RepID=A0A0M9VS70_ESCWE|nr:hypothetical protein ESCO_006540 [Escovopsis weberi]
MSLNTSSREPRFRPIQPASSDTAPGYGAAASPFKYTIPKKRAVFRACYDCRKAKTKASVASAQDPASRLEALEMLIDLLQKSSSDQAARLLQRIRASDNPVAMLDALGESTTFPSIAEVPKAKDHLERWLRSQNPSDYSSVPGSSTSSGSVLSDSDASSSFNMTSVNSHGKSRFGTVDDSAVVINEDGQDAINDMDFQLPPLAAKSRFNSAQHAVPDASITQEALKVFFICSGRLLHVFSKEKGSQLYRAVYNSQKTPAEASPLDLGCLMSIASVGAQYMCGTHGREVEKSFYEIGKQQLDAIIQHRPLDAIKVCSLLAVYNVMGKATVSLAYVEIGLGLCRRFGLNKGSSPHHTLSEGSWIDYRKTWRTLMFLSSWLSTTLGYISVELPRNTSDVVQTEIAKICVLKANILRVHLAVDDITAPALQLIVQDLQDWYTHLRPEMRLDCTGRDDLDLETKRSISHIHLHYLGAIMLFYSRIASQFMQPLKDWGSIPVDLRMMLEKLAGEAVVAARTSARVLWLLGRPIS